MEILTNDMKATISGSGYNQFGKDILITQIGFSLLEAIFELDPEVQRMLDPQRRSEIREFILKSVKKYFAACPTAVTAREVREWDKGNKKLISVQCPGRRTLMSFHQLGVQTLC